VGYRTGFGIYRELINMKKTAKRSEKKEKSPNMIPIYIMGKKYMVPETLTIMKAMECAGYQLIRGCGCRDGKCGACATVYRTADDYKIKVALACQTVVEDGMHLTQIPFYPANKSRYKMEELEPELSALMSLYPELNRCVSCNSCGKICPQDLKVMEAMAAAMRGDIERVAKLSFECIMCGLCASRCPAEIVQYNIFMLARRLYGKCILPQAQDLKKRVDEINKGKFDKELKKIKNLGKDDLKARYGKRKIEAD
jgi:formate hydrogenlyase subunit 6/NADH:ubiquinone oxidoreductase subunit I